MKIKSFLLMLVFAGVFMHFSYAQIATSAHNFSSSGWNSTGKICIVCHAPHNASTVVANAPLWNHETTTQTFTMYSSGTMDGTLGQPDESSKLCLSCHDGTIALENFGSVTGGTNMLTGTTLLGTDLSNDHPISFTYNTALATADGELEDPSTATSGLGGTIDQDMLISGKMQCSSCHDVHNTAGLASMLRIDNAGSALCMTCHTK